MSDSSKVASYEIGQPLFVVVVESDIEYFLYENVSGDSLK